MGNGITGGGGSGGSIDGVDVTDGSGRNVRDHDTSGGKGSGHALRSELDRPVIAEAPQIRTKI